MTTPSFADHLAFIEEPVGCAAHGRGGGPGRGPGAGLPGVAYR